MKILSPKVDVIFKLLFGDNRNKYILTDFLKSILTINVDDYEDIIVIDPHLKKEALDDKLGILDVKIKTKSGKIINVEIQIVDVPEMKERIVYYISKMITEQLGTGDDYDNLKSVISIIILDYPLINDTARCHTVFELLEKDEYFPFNNLIQINILDLTRIPESGKEQKYNWLRFINSKREEEFNMLADINPAINEAYKQLQMLSEDEVNRELYESRLKAQRDENSRIKGALRKGMEKGMEKAAIEFLQEGDSVERVSKVLKLPIERVLELREQI